MQEVSGSIPLGSTIFALLIHRLICPLRAGENGGAKRLSFVPRNRRDSDSVARARRKRRAKAGRKHVTDTN